MTDAGQSAAQTYSQHNPSPALGTPDGTLPVTGLDLAGLSVLVLFVLVAGIVAYHLATRTYR